MSAFVAASFDYVSPAGGLHARTESVDLTSLSFLGLISAFHLFCSFYSYSPGRAASVILRV